MSAKPGTTQAKNTIKPFHRSKKIMIGLMPFWSPLTPPLGISVLKSYLSQQDFHVKTHDFNTETELWEILDKYFKIIAEAVPEQKQSNFHMVGFDVLSNHLMVFLHKNKTQDRLYQRLIKTLMRKNYFVDINEHVVIEMDRVVAEFYVKLKGKFLEVIRKIKPDVFGLSVYSTSLAPSLYAFQLAKEELPGIETVMGGGVFADHLAPGSQNLQVLLERTEPYIDSIIIGEGELLFKKYLSGELEPGKRVYSLDNINRETLPLDSVTIPDFSDLNLSAYSQMGTYASRSCPFQCGFCSETVQWGKFRKKKAEQVVKEIASIKEQYGGKLFMFGDSLVNPVISDISSGLIQEGMDIYWDAYLRTDPGVSQPENTDLWRKGGFYRARLGVESGSQAVLDAMNKNMSVHQVKNAISSLANSGIKTTTYWVIGYPGESEEDFSDTLKLLADIKDDIYEADWHPFYFFPHGQVNSERWVKQQQGLELLYPEEFTGLLLTQTWILTSNPGREETYHRMNRFADQCRKLNIPNPYSMMEIYQADKRWKQLHPNCGPSLLELHNYKFLK
jgi:radical SAM superfamily enzyme YgiQ (UPF0313 family)